MIHAARDSVIRRILVRRSGFVTCPPNQSTSYLDLILCGNFAQFCPFRVFLPPATKLGQGYIFTGVCDSVHRGVSASVHAGIPPAGSRHPSKAHPLGADPPEQTIPQADTTPEQTPLECDSVPEQIVLKCCRMAVILMDFVPQSLVLLYQIF